MSNGITVATHFADVEPDVAAIYQKLLSTARTFGQVVEDPKKTSIHLVRKSAFAGVATRKSALILTLKSTTDVKSPRIAKREQASANRWHLIVRLEQPQDVDKEIAGWLKRAYEIAG